MIGELMRRDILCSIKMAQLDSIALKHKCELFLPPFQNRNNPFYVIVKKESHKIKKIMRDIEKNEFNYSKHNIKNKVYIEILGL
jgi:hypothetical protein